MVKILQPITSTWLDYPDKEDCSLVVVMMGCDNGCPRCQNPDFKNPNCKINTKEYTVESLIDELKILAKRNRTDKVVLSGGDPLSCFNIEFTKKLLLETDLKICIYTGHDIDYVKKHNVKGGRYCSFLLHSFFAKKNLLYPSLFRHFYICLINLT